MDLYPGVVVAGIFNNEQATDGGSLILREMPRLPSRNASDRAYWGRCKHRVRVLVQHNDFGSMVRILGDNARWTKMFLSVLQRQLQLPQTWRALPKPLASIPSPIKLKTVALQGSLRELR